MTKLTDEELKKLPRSCMPFNTGGAVIVNKKILASICKELVELRKQVEQGGGQL